MLAEPPAGSERVMKTSPKPIAGRRAERGAALIVSILCMSLLLALALALLLSTTTDTLISNSYRASSEAFFAADGGLAVGRRALQKALSEQVAAVCADKNRFYRASTQILPDSSTAPDHEFFGAVSARFAQIANDERRSLLPNGSRYQLELVAFTGGPTNPAQPRAANGQEYYRFDYTIRSLGRSERGARAQVEEHGRLELPLRTKKGNPVREPFSKFGTFFDVGSEDPLVLVSGKFTGPVHTNTRFSFSSRYTVKFESTVTQVDKAIVYDGKTVPIPTDGMDGILVGQGMYRQERRVEPPPNNYSQEISVITPTSAADDPEQFPVDGQGRATPEALSKNLVDARGNNPQPRGSRIPPGVYIASSDGASMTGSGIYVQGDADVELSTSGSAQVIKVRQGGRTTTVTIDYEADTTTIVSGADRYTVTGVPRDPDFSRPGASMFVNGSVTSLSGPPAVNGQTPPALASKTALTITAQRHVRITGDIKYPEPVVGPTGADAPAAATLESVLGIYTNDGNVELAPDSTRVDGGGQSLEIHAAIACFDRNEANNAGAKEGVIYYAGSAPPGPKDKLTIVGSRVQQRIGNIGYKNRAVFFDPRFRDGNFAPPFFPGTSVTVKPPEFGATFDGEQAIHVYADSWQRDERRRKKSATE